MAGWTSVVARSAEMMQAETLKWSVSWMATVSTIGLFLTGISICRKVQKQGDTKDITMVPFIVTAANCALWLKYGLLRHDSTLIAVNSTGLLLELVYLAFYFAHTGITTRRQVSKQILVSLVIFATIFIYASHYSLHPDVAVGYVGSVTAMGVYASPLATVKEVLRHRSTEFMSFPLCAAGLVVSCEWFLYGTLIADNFITLPNFVGVMFAVFQMALFGKFPSSRSKEPLRTASSLV